MTTLLAETFTGTDGDPWNTSNWTTAEQTAGATATIQGNRGRLDTGSATGYAGHMFMKRNAADIADAEVNDRFRYNGTQDGHLEVWLRCDNGGANPANGYFLSLNRYGTVTLYQYVAFSGTAKATYSITFSTGVDYKFRFSLVGTALNAKVWLASDTEPTPWSMTATATGVTAAGVVMLAGLGGGDPGLTIDMDDVTITDGASGVTRVTKTIAVSADVRQRVTRAASVTADVKQRGTMQIAIVADVLSDSRTRVTKTIDVTADVRQRQTRQVTVSADVLVNDDLTMQFYVKWNGALIRIASV